MEPMTPPPTPGKRIKSRGPEEETATGGEGPPPLNLAGTWVLNCLCRPVPESRTVVGLGPLGSVPEELRIHQGRYDQ